ncbi:nucleotidyltransferase domain-containing protein [uncultured Clostridium sp.]|uniref:nucleotidyltransferase domain-containing protein n=1 Tax=uncultured Clostridium sp. TaxID=59620 RepID=UPI0028ED0C2F|nr:nucleotidyltransferase domain-containing protein [uncultured Clostridium sp.]
MNFPTQIGTDREGYIINYTSKDNISLNYLLILEELIQLLKQDLNDKLHSIYVYGSVGRGEAILGKSDIDLSIVLNLQLTRQELEKLNNHKNEFLEENKMVPKIDFDIGTLNDVLKEENLYYWGFWIKHICTCIYGEDLSINFPKMKPNRSICQSLNQDVISSLINYKDNIIKNEVDSNMLISALKRIIRGAYCLVAVIDKSWITKIEDIIIVLNYYFPSETSFKDIDLMLKGKEEVTSKQVLKLIDYFIPWFNRHRI